MILGRKKKKERTKILLVAEMLIKQSKLFAA